MVNRCFPALLLLAACGTVDTPAPPRPAPILPAPGPKPTPSSGVALDGDCGLDFAGFAARIADAVRRDPGPLAVFPPCTDDPQHASGTQVFATAAGDWVAARVVASLRATHADLAVWTPAAAASELQRSNRSLADVRRPEDLIGLVAAAEGTYAVFGSLEKERIGSRFEGRTRVRVHVRCVHVADATDVAELSGTIEDEAAVRELLMRLERGSDTPVGARAQGFVPTLDRELELCVERSLRRLVAQHRPVLAGRRVALATPGTSAAIDVVRRNLASDLPRRLPGQEAIAVVQTRPDLTLRATLEKGARQWALVLRVERGGGAADLQVATNIDVRFTEELDAVAAGRR